MRTGHLATRIKEESVEGSFSHLRRPCYLIGPAGSLAHLIAEHALHELEIILEATQSASEGCAIGLETGF